MDENNIFQEQSQAAAEPGIKPKHTASLVLGILSIVFAFLFALAGDILGIIGLVLAIVKRKDYNTKTGMILCIIGLVLSVASHIIGVMMVSQVLASIVL